MARFNKHGIATLYKEPRLLGGFGRRAFFIDEFSRLNNNQQRELFGHIHHHMSQPRSIQHIMLIGDPSLGKSSFIGRPTPEVIRQMEFNRNNNKF